LPRPSLTSLAVASFLGFGALLVLYGANSSELIVALGLDYAELGLLGSMLSLGLGLGIVLAGPIIDRAPRRPLFVAATALVVASTLLIGPRTGYTALLGHTFALGFGAGFYETVLNTLIVERFGEQAPRRLVFVHAAATAAASATPLLFELARGFATIPWHATFRVVGLAHVLLLAMGALSPMDAAPARALERGQGLERAKTRTVETEPGGHATGGAGTPSPSERAPDDRLALAAICLATFAYVGVESAISLFVADHATSVLALEASRGARAISAFWGGLLVGRLAIGLSPRPVGPGTVSLCACAAVGMMIAFGSGWITTPELAMTLVGAFLGGVFPVMIGTAGLALPSAAGLAVGLAGGLGSLGGFTIPWLTGRLASATDLPTALTSLGAWLAALVAAAAFVARRRSALRTRCERGGIVQP
jgi:fucose permease